MDTNEKIGMNEKKMYSLFQLSYNVFQCKIVQEIIINTF